MTKVALQISRESGLFNRLGWLKVLMKGTSQAEIKISGRNINNLRNADDSKGRKWRGTKDHLVEGGRGEWKGNLKLNFQKSKITGSHPITSWQNDGGKSDTVTDFIFVGSKITVDSDCSHKIKRYLLLGRKAMTNLDSICKSRDITLLTKVKVMVFPVAMCACERKDEQGRIDAFELWCWRRLFESPLDCKEIKPVNRKEDQSWIFIGRTDAEAETPILWPPDAKNWLIGKDPDVGKDWGQEEKGVTEDEMVGWQASLTQ